MMTAETEESRRKWGESAYYWEKNRGFIERIYKPITESLIEKSRIQVTDRLLDLAGGIGEPSLSIAQIFHDKVTIICTDLVHQMLRAAQNETENRNIRLIQFCRCSGDHLPFNNESFDVVISRIGIMFFPDINRALKEILRVLKSEGRVSFAVWHKKEFNPMFEIVVKVLEEFIPLVPEPADAPGPFRFSDEGHLINLMKEAGFFSVSETVLDFEIKESVNFDEFWRIRSEMSDTLRDKLIQLTPVQLSQLHRKLEAEFAPYFVTGNLRVPARVIIVSGRKN